MMMSQILGAFFVLGFVLGSARWALKMERRHALLRREFKKLQSDLFWLRDIKVPRPGLHTNIDPPAEHQLRGNA